MGNSAQLVAIALGSNLGNKLTYLKQATLFISELESIELLHTSSIYESDSFEFNSKPFLNNVILVHCSIYPQDLLIATQEIEKKLGRRKTGERSKKYNDRTIDMDIIFFGNTSINTPNLILPHPEATKRNFVLFPLLELQSLYVPKQNKYMETIEKSVDNNGINISDVKTKEYFQHFIECKRK